MAALLAPPPLLLLLLLPRPALGNEGATAGSCKCRREAEEPPIVKHFPERLRSCQTCPGDMFRFKFPQIHVCGHKTDSWALRFWHSSCNTTYARLPEEEGHRQGMRAEASMPRRAPTPTSCSSTVPLETAPSPAGPTDEAPGTQPASPASTTDAPWAPGRATPLAGGDLAEAGPSQLSLQEEASSTPGAGGSRVAVMSLIGVALASVAVTVLVVCMRRRRGQGRLLVRHPGEEMRCLPCKET